MSEICYLTKKYGEHVLFDKFNLTIEDGDFVVIAGKSGCGKTTLLNMIGGIEPFDSGEIRVNHQTFLKRKEQMNYFRNVVGFLFQNFALVDHKTVKQNLEMIKPKYRAECSVEEVLHQVGLYEKLHEKVYKLSGGEQQRVALARLMLKKCDIILADEPTGSLDSGNASAVITILQKMNQQGKTIVMVTHDTTLYQVGNRLITL